MPALFQSQKFLLSNPSSTFSLLLIYLFFWLASENLFLTSLTSLPIPLFFFPLGAPIAGLNPNGCNLNRSSDNAESLTC